MKIDKAKLFQSAWNFLVPFILILLVVNLYFKNNYINKSLENSRKVYVYSLERVVESSNILKMKQDFEADILKLNEEVNTAQEKIKSIKDANVKAEFSDVYLNSLKLKRDTLVEDYGKEMQKMSDFINNALSKIAKKYDASTIYNDKLIAVKTPYVIDLTDEIVKLIKSDEEIIEEETK